MHEDSGEFIRRDLAHQALQPSQPGSLSKPGSNSTKVCHRERMRQSLMDGCNVAENACCCGGNCEHARNGRARFEQSLHTIEERAAKLIGERGGLGGLRGLSAGRRSGGPRAGR